MGDSDMEDDVGLVVAGVLGAVVMVGDAVTGFLKLERMFLF